MESGHFCGIVRVINERLCTAIGFLINHLPEEKHRGVNVILVDEHENELILSYVIYWAVDYVIGVITSNFMGQFFPHENSIHNLILGVEHVEDLAPGDQDLVIDNAIFISPEGFHDCLAVSLMEVQL